jgi:8-oxo-dGTP diphosphatase
LLATHLHSLAVAAYIILIVIYGVYFALVVAKIPHKIFIQIEKYMPFSSVDILILKDQKIILTKRAISPYRGYWHLPGSVILKNERMADTVTRSSREELGIEVGNPIFIGNYETFTKYRHYITHLFIAKYYSGKIKLDFQSSAVITVHPSNIPNHTIPIQKLMIKDTLKADALPPKFGNVS